MIPWANALAIPMQLLIGAAVATLARGRTKALAVAIGLVSFLPPFLPDRDQHVVRIVAALGTITVVFRALDLAIDQRTWPLAQRLWLFYAVFDSRTTSRRSALFDGRAWAKAAGFALLAAIGAGGALLIGRPVSSMMWAARWLCGACVMYGVFDMGEALIRAAYAAAGIHVPRFHTHPIAARSLDDFWGRRWNMIVQGILSRHCFRPLVRRGFGRVAVAAAFVASGVLHFWLIAAAHEMFWALTSAGFFVVQGVGLLLERPLGVARWRPALQHLWVVAWVGLASPLMVEPMMLIFGL